MQIRGKILTIAGIVLVFGYFIIESLKNPSSVDPNQIIMVGNDTLGRNWGAMADQKERDKLAASQEQVTTITSEDSKDESLLIKESEDPYLKDKFNSSDYSSIESPDGREIITGYNNPDENPDEIDNGDNYQTRHQKEMNEPQIKYRD